MKLGTASLTRSARIAVTAGVLLGFLQTNPLRAAERPSVGSFATDDGALMGVFPCSPTSFQEPAPLASMPPVRGYKCGGPTFQARVQYFDYPPTAVDPKVILDHARDGSLSNVKDGRLVSEQTGMLAGRPGREVVIAAQGVTLRERFVVEGDDNKTRLYVISFGTVPSEATNPQIQAFFDSIRFKTDRTGGPSRARAR